ncbi:unnamed protein product [Cuscuta campestris]|uniref:Integrase catalytic domain-containing protein n=1 Tax=Cuscuta campestris TaxID=132261 RepID=A0A484MQ83_9ASTE|nr:unnamed protein product [Cuscuta campestris]
MLAVFWMAKRLTPYFQAHRIVVLTNEPLASLTRSPAASARMTKWAVFISQYNVEFRSRPLIKGQALDDFEVECTAREMTRAQADTRVEDDCWNAEADFLSKLSAESPEYIRKLATVEELATPSLNRDEVFRVSADPPEWLDRLARYIEDGVAPEDPRKAHLLRMRAPTYKVQDGVLYKQSYNGVLLRCHRAAEAKALMEEMHEGNMLGRPATNYTPISSVIPFSRWGIDIVGALPKGVGQARWIVVAIDYFTKWVEAEPLTGITGRQMIDFVGTNILCRIPWTYKTTPRRATGDTPFGLAYGFEARAPVEAVIPTRREIEYDPEVNEKNQAIELNFVEKRRDEARIRVENYRRHVKSYFDNRVKPRAFQVGDYVLRKREKSQPTKGGKLAKKYEGPYIIKAVVRPGRGAGAPNEEPSLKDFNKFGEAVRLSREGSALTIGKECPSLALFILWVKAKSWRVIGGLGGDGAGRRGSTSILLLERSEGRASRHFRDMRGVHSLTLAALPEPEKNPRAGRAGSLDNRLSQSNSRLSGLSELRTFLLLSPSWMRHPIVSALQPPSLSQKKSPVKVELVERESRISELESSLQEAKQEGAHLNDLVVKHIEAKRLTLEKLGKERQTASELRSRMGELEKAIAAHQEEVSTLTARAEALYEEGKFDMQHCIYEAVQSGLPAHQSLDDFISHYGLPLPLPPPDSHADPGP